MSSDRQHSLRKTKQDMEHEVEMLRWFAKHLGCEYTHCETEGKYRIDGIMHKAGEVVGYVECKWYSDNWNGFIGMNVPKYREIRDLGMYSDSRSDLLIRVPGALGVIQLWDYSWPKHIPKIRMAGSTPPGREPNWDDYEPMAMFTEDQVEWIVGKRAKEAHAA